MDIQGCLKASLIALGVLTMATWLPHMYSGLRAFLLVSLPSVASAVTAPKCLFVFSNIIVVFLVGESRLSKPQTGKRDDDDDVVANGAAGDIIRPRQEEQEVVIETLSPMIAFAGDHESEQERQDNAVAVVVEEEEEEEVALLAHDEGAEMDQGHDQEEVEEATGGGDGLVVEEEAEKDDVEERDLPPADELNRRVEDFIARFNMERRLEARMLVCCC